MQRFESKGSITSVASSSRGHSKKNAATHMIVQREEDNQMMLLPVTHLVNGSVTKIRVNNSATFKTDLTSRKQERGRIIQLGKVLIEFNNFKILLLFLGSEDVCNEQLQVFEMVASIATEEAINKNHQSKKKKEENKNNNSKHLRI